MTADGHKFYYFLYACEYGYEPLEFNMYEPTDEILDRSRFNFMHKTKLQLDGAALWNSFSQDHILEPNETSPRTQPKD